MAIASLKKHSIFLKWWWFFTLIVALTVVLVGFGVHEDLWMNDRTKLSFFILFIFYAMTLHCGYESWKLSKLANGDIPKLEYLTDLDKFILLSYVFCCIPTFISIGFSRFILKTKKLQTKVTKINSYIRKWGGFVYLLISFQIFYSVN